LEASFIPSLEGLHGPFSPPPPPPPPALQGPRPSPFGGIGRLSLLNGLSLFPDNRGFREAVKLLKLLRSPSSPLMLRVPLESPSQSRDARDLLCSGILDVLASFEVRNRDTPSFRFLPRFRCAIRKRPRTGFIPFFFSASFVSPSLSLRAPLFNAVLGNFYLSQREGRGIFFPEQAPLPNFPNGGSQSPN